MYKGRVQLGQEVVLGVLCHDASGTPTLPDAVPTVDLWTGSTKVIAAKGLPILDRYQVNGLFQFRLFLDARFSNGFWKALYRFKVGSYQGLEEDTFEVIAGGTADGTVIASHFYSRPFADFVVQHLSSGRVIKGRNPTV